MNRRNPAPDGRTPAREARRLAGARRAYTLIELLVVISIIAALAGLLFVVLSGVDKQKTRRLVAAQMAQVETALDHYHARIGFYPSWPTNRNAAVSPLYYELVGTLRPDANTFQTLDRRWTVSLADVTTVLGLDRFVNAGEVGVTTLNLDNKDPDSVRIANYLPNLKDTQVTTNHQGIALLGVPVKGPNGRFCEWNYWSPGIHHPESFDLWVVVTIDNNTVTNGNWHRSQ